MSLIDFIKNLFGNASGSAKEKQRFEEMNAKWENDRKVTIAAIEERLKGWLINLIKEKNGLSFSWESGNDEGFVTFLNYEDENDQNFNDLEHYIVEKLDIPSAGEFQMNGKGNIYIESGNVKVKYSSIIKETIDYNEETEEEIFGEDAYDEGDVVLFSVGDN